MNIVMPKLGLTMTEGTLTEWLKQPGEAVRQGEILFLFESEKATMEYESPADGILGLHLLEIGSTVACGTPVVTLRTGTETIKSPTVAAQSQIAVSSSPPAINPTSVSTATTTTATPAAKRRARELSVDIDNMVGRGPNGRVQLVDVEAAVEDMVTERHGDTVSPVARRLAADLGIELDGVQGSGGDGRVGRDDVLAAARQALSAGPTPLSATERPQVTERPTYSSRTTLSGVRNVIARRMSESAFSAPHVTLHTEADATALVEARRQINQELAGGIKISYNALLVALAARALREHPALNACLVDDEIRIYEAVNMALAVDTERGLLVPVIRNADQLDIIAIQDAGDASIQRALAGDSRPDDLSGGTFTLTNLGMYEIDAFTPIINQPQSAILGVGRIVSKPVDVGGQVVLRQMMALSLSFDHRIVDGGPAARFLQRVKQLIERPMALSLPGR